ncbi:hypothetical protein DB30_03780 [Enhygromyxa salina]|uniref:Uncharacterized protein n=1 Tax=Enhygromyxa salina TaxID=215803 RepID=A0A0C2A1B7_9BACT|nr:hypothetical protein [Enhygromyxa salina]KIG17183.1 hypothetical protein DB30_03780 [Enhygromyxa salina]
MTESAAERIEADVGPLPNGPSEPLKPDPHGGLGRGGGSVDGGGGSGGCARCATAEDDYEMAGGLAATTTFAMFGVFGLRRRRRDRY